MSRHRTVDVGGLPIHYREAGEPGLPALLLLQVRAGTTRSSPPNVSPWSCGSCATS
jgi:hypothetical protein